MFFSDQLSIKLIPASAFRSVLSVFLKIIGEKHRKSFDEFRFWDYTVSIVC